MTFRSSYSVRQGVNTNNNLGNKKKIFFLVKIFVVIDFTSMYGLPDDQRKEGREGKKNNSPQGVANFNKIEV